MEVYMNGNSGNKCFGQDEVLFRWKNDFKDLYNRPDDEDQNSDDEFYENVLSSVTDIKSFELRNIEADVIEYNRPFTPDELDKIRCKMKNNKAVGPDMIPNEMLKHEGIKALLLSFVNTCFMNNVIPSVWRSSIIAPIPKSASKDPCVPLNYRGISLLSCLYKLYTSMLNLRLTSYCENNDYLVDEQNGFRPKRSCQDHVYVLSSIIRNRKIQKKDTFCAFVDFKKAFDWVSRDLLLYKISTLFNIHGRLFNTLSTIYSSSSAQIRVNGLLTESFEVTSGVKQGDIISPILFSMYLNDLATGLKELNCGIDVDGLNLSILLYADDIVLMAPDENALQKMLQFIDGWCKKWRMAINSDKTQVVHFRTKSKMKSEFQFSLGSNNLSTVSFYKYLGVIFDEHLSF